VSPRSRLALQKHPERVGLTESWPTLPEALRAGILATVNAANG
jgi:hypothetical protein